MITRSFGEELANGVTHGIGVGLSIAGLVVLVVSASVNGSVWSVVGCSIYGATLVILYTASTLYHSFRGPRLKRIFQVADHSCIFLLIAGTYTPFTITVLRGGLGWSLFGVVWGMALAGIIGKVALRKKSIFDSAVPYVIMGWLAVIAIKPIVEKLPEGGPLLLLLGGLIYTVGVVFYVRDRIPYYHTVWHVFVLAGSICHYFAILLYVIPAS